MIKLSDNLSLVEPYDLSLAVVGLGVLGLATLLHRFNKYPFSFPILALLFGYTVFALPLPLTRLDPLEHRDLTVHLTELGVILSLMGVGLKIDRTPGLRNWSTTWRLLLICMPLTIVGVAVLGWWLIGLTPAAAMLLGAALAPTDPVLASDVQVGEPGVAVDESTSAAIEEAFNNPDPAEREDELRFTLTSEAGLNDSLAFPFTFLALHLLTKGSEPRDWLYQWLAVDVAYRIIVGTIVGVGLGWGLSHLLLSLPVDSRRRRMKAGIGALAATLLIYAVTECLAGYGFLAVFLGAITIRHREKATQLHQSMHTFAEQSEELLMTIILITLGGAIAGGLLAPLTWSAALVGTLLLLVVRPLAGLLSLVSEPRLPWLDRIIVSFFGIRGIGCLYYLAYGVEQKSFPEEELLWATCAFAVVLSIVIHGMTASPVIQFRDKRLLS